MVHKSVNRFVTENPKHLPTYKMSHVRCSSFSVGTISRLRPKQSSTFARRFSAHGKIFKCKYTQASDTRFSASVHPKRSHNNTTRPMKHRHKRSPMRGI